MKFKSLLIVYIVAIIVLTFSSYAQNQTQINFLQNREAEEEFKRQREDWIEQMHRIEPGINWRIIDNETRFSKSELRQEQIKKKLKEGSNILSGEEEIAGGLLKGKWIERGSNNCAGRIHTADIDFEKNLIYAASSGGNIWRGTIDGNNWQCLNNSFQISNIRMIKILKIGNVKRIVVVGNGTHLYYSDNEGLTWEDAKGLEVLQKWGGIKRALITSADGKEIYILCNEWDWKNWKGITSIYKSSDKGENFWKIYSSYLDVSLCDIWSDKYSNYKVYFEHKDTLSSIDSYSVIDNIGVLNLLQNANDIQRVYLRGNCYKNDKHLVLFILDKKTNKYNVFRSTNEGQNWEARGIINFSPFEHNSMAVSITNPDVMYFGGVELYRSFDGGATWSKCNNWWDYYSKIMSKLHADIPGVDVFKNPESDTDITLVSTDGGIYISTNNTDSVYNLSSSGLNVSQYYSTYTDKKDYTKVYAGSQDQGLQRCLLDSNNLISFNQVISGDYGHLSSSDSGKTLWSVYPGFAHVYLNFDSVNTKRYAWDFKYKNGLWMPPLIEDPENPKAAYLASGGENSKQQLWHLICQGDSIFSENLNYDFNQDSSGSVLSAMAISPFDKNIFYAMTNNGRFFFSNDKGSTWKETEQFKGPGSHYFYGSHIVPSHKTANKIYIAGSGYSNPGVYVSQDNGMNFSPLDSGLPKTMIYEIAVSPDDEYIFAATEVGPYIYISSQNSWFALSGLNAPDQTYWSVEYLPDLQTARFGTYGRGIWDFKITNISGNIESQNIATKFVISAYPNPLKNSSLIQVDSPDESYCQIKIFDVEGKIVSYLFDGKLKSGINQFSWNGLSDNGIKLPQGVYLCIINASGTTDYCKIIIN